MSMDTSNPGQALDWQKLLFSFEGRTRRSHFWIGWLICFGAGAVANILPVVGQAIALALLWPNHAIAVKRLHDMGKSGWLVVIPWVVGIVGSIAAVSMMGLAAFTNASALEEGDPAAFVALLGPALGIFALIFLVCIGFLLWVGLSGGQSGDNRFGPDPKGS
jgi:uncharacterized membrane protein YhaH (DUF805 family)